MSELLGIREINKTLKMLDSSWSATDGSLKRVIEFPSFPEAVGFIQALVPECEAMDHHPDISIRWKTVLLSISTHSAGGITAADFDLADVVDLLLKRRLSRSL